MRPGDFCHRRWQNFRVGPGEGAHAPEVAGGEARDAGEGGGEVAGHALDDARAPALPLLLGGQVSPDLPVEQQQLAVDGQGGAQLGGADALLEVGEEGGVAGGGGFSRGEFARSGDRGGLGIRYGVWDV